MASEIKLDRLKEGVDSVEVNAVKVAVGDMVTKDQPILEVQADKAALEVPAPLAGRIAKINVKVGDQVKVGEVYCTIDAAGGNGEAKAPAAVEKAPAAKAPAEKPAPEKAPSRIPDLAPKPAPAAVATVALAPAGKDAHAGPATRRLAREFGVDLTQVRGSGKHGRILEDDVKAFVRQLASGAVAPMTTAGAPAAPPLPRFEDWGTVERQPLSPIRKLTARQMSLAWSQIPHVTQNDLADITDLDTFRKESSGGPGPKLTVTAFAIKACAIALKEFPDFNASLDLANNQLVHKRYYNIGVAVDTPSGLLVPVLKDVDKKSITQLAEEMNAVAARARDKKIDPNELKGGTFTITNLGGIGGTGFTPIVNWPEVAILGMSRGRLEPVVHHGQIVPRLMLPLSLSYDHRVIDGASAARFTRRLADLLENPLLMLLKA